MQHLITQQLRQHFPHQTDFLIGLSGGIDSVVLLDLMQQQPHLNLRAVHIHHGLSKNADDWAIFCQQCCAEYGIPLIVKPVRVSGSAGVEANARQARYQAISELIRAEEVFVTAHHLDDQAETLLLALKRGSGIKGLSAMQAVSVQQNFTFFRPLLSCTKTAISAYAEQRGLRWINDESNSNNRYDRNFLRNEILPMLNQRWPQFQQMVARSAQHCAEQQQLIDELLEEDLASRIGTQHQFDISGFERLSPLKQKQLVRLWLEKRGIAMPSTAQLQAVISELIFAKADKNPEVKLANHIIRRYRQAIFITDTAHQPSFTLDIPPQYDTQLPHHSGTLQRNGGELLCTINGKTHRLSLPNALKNELLRLTFGHHGRVREYGKPHREEMKKIWQKHQIPTWERDHTPLLFWQDDLVAVLA